MTTHAELLEAVAALLCERNGDAWEPQSDEFKEWGREDARAILSLIGERLLEPTREQLVAAAKAHQATPRYQEGMRSELGDYLRAEYCAALAASPLYPPKEE